MKKTFKRIFTMALTVAMLLTTVAFAGAANTVTSGSITGTGTVTAAAVVVNNVVVPSNLNFNVDITGARDGSDTTYANAMVYSPLNAGTTAYQGYSFYNWSGTPAIVEITVGFTGGVQKKQPSDVDVDGGLNKATKDVYAELYVQGAGNFGGTNKAPTSDGAFTAIGNFGEKSSQTLAFFFEGVGTLDPEQPIQIGKTGVASQAEQPYGLRTGTVVSGVASVETSLDAVVAVIPYAEASRKTHVPYAAFAVGGIVNPAADWKGTDLKLTASYKITSQTAKAAENLATKGSDTYKLGDTTKFGVNGLAKATAGSTIGSIGETLAIDADAKFVTTGTSVPKIPVTKEVDYVVTQYFNWATGAWTTSNPLTVGTGANALTAGQYIAVPNGTNKWDVYVAPTLNTPTAAKLDDFTIDIVFKDRTILSGTWYDEKADIATATKSVGDTLFYYGDRTVTSIEWSTPVDATNGPLWGAATAAQVANITSDKYLVALSALAAPAIVGSGNTAKNGIRVTLSNGTVVTYLTDVDGTT
jgi:hypothetical protein